MYFVYINENYLYNERFRKKEFNDNIFSEMLELELYLKKNYLISIPAYGKTEESVHIPYGFRCHTKAKMTKKYKIQNVRHSHLIMGFGLLIQSKKYGILNISI